MSSVMLDFNNVRFVQNYFGIFHRELLSGEKMGFVVRAGLLTRRMQRQSQWIRLQILALLLLAAFPFGLSFLTWEM